MKNNPYRLLGTGLIIAGTIFTPVAYFLIRFPSPPLHYRQP